MWTKRRNREGKRRKEWKKEQRRREDRKEEKANETKERIPRAVFPEAFVCFVFSLVVKWNYCSINRHSPFLLFSAAGERTSKPRSLPPFSVCYLFLSSCLLVHPPPPPPPLTFSRLPTFERAHASLVKFARRRTKPSSSFLSHSSLHTPPPTARIPKIPSEIADGIFLLLVLSYLSPVGITVPLVPSTDIPPPGRQIKFLEERRKDHLPFFRPSGNLKPVPLYQKKLLPSPPTAATTTITTTLLQDPIAPSVFQPILALLALANKLGRAWGWNDYLDLRDDYVTTARLKSERALYQRRRKRREGEVTDEGIESHCFLWERCVDIPFALAVDPSSRGV